MSLLTLRKYVKEGGCKHKILVISVLIGILLILLVCNRFIPQREVNMIKNKWREEILTDIKIIDVYDNVVFNPEFATGFGFACIVKSESETILFDTGGDSPTLLANLEKTGLRPEDIDKIVLSHIHGDHTGGLLGFLNKNSNVTVYVPNSFPSSLKNHIKATGASLVDITNSVKIAQGIYSTGELGTVINEQSLIINYDKGLIIITGCAHPGIINIIKKAKELLDRDVYLLTGGFHHPSLDDIKKLKDLGVQKVAPGHCTGEEATSALEKEFRENFIRSGVGKVIKCKR